MILYKKETKKIELVARPDFECLITSLIFHKNIKGFALKKRFSFNF